MLSRKSFLVLWLLLPGIRRNKIYCLLHSVFAKRKGCCGSIVDGPALFDRGIAALLCCLTSGRSGLRGSSRVSVHHLWKKWVLGATSKDVETLTTAKFLYQ